MTPEEMRARRRRRLAKLHCLRRDLGLTEEEYRGALAVATGQESAVGLSLAQLSMALNHFTELARDRGVLSTSRRPRNTTQRPQLTVIEALLTEMDLPWSYADAIARRQCGSERVAWCRSDELVGVIAALKRHQKKVAAP